MSQHSDIILAQACTWLSKIQSEQDYDATAFSDWLIVDNKHSKAFNEVRDNWQLLSQLKSDTSQSAKVIPIATKENDNNNTEVDHKTTITVVKVIAKSKWSSLTVLAASVILITLLQLLPEGSKAKHYTSVMGELKTITLEDGSQVILNAKSTLTTHFTGSQRLVFLEEGDGHFIVAKDNKRPFVVKVKQHSFTALGTAFSINTRGKLTILVTQHSVAIQSNDKQQILNEQQALTYHQNTGNKTNTNLGWQPISLPQARQKMAWQQGRITFQSQPLHQVLMSLSPYIDKPINLVNLSMKDEKVTGSFELIQADDALVMIALGLDMKVKNKTDQVLLY